MEAALEAMCGITGIFSPDGVAAYRSGFIAAHDIIDYRGPDDQGIVLLEPGSKRAMACDSSRVICEYDWTQFSLAIGHRRLAILDLSSLGHQPMANESKTQWIVFNGEIYNYLEVRAELEHSGHVFCSATDTEVILHAYEKWGEDCVNRFNGMWAFAIVDVAQGILFCSRDRFGVKPFHYYYDGRQFIFGSEIKQLLAFSHVTRRVNARAVYEFLAHGISECGEGTFFEEISRLPPGHNLTLNLTNSALKVSRYYSPVLRINSNLTLLEAGQQFGRLLTDSVRLRLRSDVPVGSCLSGGLDSSSIVCLARQILRDQHESQGQHVFCSHFEAPEANELSYMQEIIRATGVQAHIIRPTPAQFLDDLNSLVWQQEEPFGSTSVFAQWSVFKQVRQLGIKVILDGQGADEQLAGYLGLVPLYFRELSRKQQWVRFIWETWRHSRLQGKSWFSLLGGYLAGLASRFRGLSPGPGAIASGVWIATDLDRRYRNDNSYAASLRMQPFGDEELLNNALYQLSFVNNLQMLLKFEDRNSMAFSVEARLPFLDYRIVEFLFSLPSRMKIKHGYTKRVLREGMKGTIPENVRWRVSKLGFATPEQQWQRSILRPLVAEALRSENLKPFIDPKQAVHHLHDIEQNNLVDLAPWRWVSLHLWLKAYVGT